MTAHHEGGIHMAEFAAEQGSRRDVRSLAERMAENQRGEIVDLHGRARPRPGLTRGGPSAGTSPAPAARAKQEGAP